MIKFFKQICEQVIDDFGLTTYTERVCFAILVVDVAVFVISFAYFLVGLVI